MAGRQHGQVEIESITAATGLGVLAVVCGGIFLGVLNSLLHGDVFGAFAVHRVQGMAIGHISTAAVIGSVMAVFVRGTSQELLAKASAVVYGAAFFESILGDLLSSSFGVGFGLFISPLYSVLTFFGYVIAFHVLFERDDLL
ncbi:hypothetical protein ACFQMA_15435 [Halosimplex aquaticum]|uniref:Branched-chain amino acid transport system / permease component n=1 Tax=Halosimplex aquaticum TaxID=3026162 RepID=A0ABD5Y1S8_9EURY|nr:hypothetical protein [Halosimplex aquaticum]